MSFKKGNKYEFTLTVKSGYEFTTYFCLYHNDVETAIPNWANDNSISIKYNKTTTITPYWSMINLGPVMYKEIVVDKTIVPKEGDTLDIAFTWILEDVDNVMPANAGQGI